jgi:neutral ceramidase
MKVGVSKVNITFYNEGKGMMGYGMHFHKTSKVKTELFARCTVIFDEVNNKKLIFVCAELCFPTIALKHEIIQRVKPFLPNITEDNFMFTAQHTHSSPAGLSHHLFYNIVTPGFQVNIFNNIAKQISNGIIEADKKLKKCNIKYGQDAFDENIPIAFNRSMKPYNANPEIETTINESQKCIDRNMRMLLFVDENNTPITAINWFGVHTTSISNDKNDICADNKGYAAALHEAENNNFISTFAQEAAGDVTPNYIWDKKKNWTRGIYEDDYLSAEWHGNQQKIKANSIIETLLNNENSLLKNSTIDCISQNYDFSNTSILQNFAHLQNEAKTGSPAIGVAMLAGTKEGPGMHPIVAQLTIIMSQIIKLYEQTILQFFINARTKKRIKEKYKAHGNKNIVIEAGVGRLLGTSSIKDFIVPSWADPTIAYLKQIGRTRFRKITPWVPKILPLQIFQIANIAIVSIPGEITTIAAKRLRLLLLKELQPKGIQEIIISSYANAYCGYITTFEEYQLQHYEGGHTVYGQHTLGALLTNYKNLTEHFINNIPIQKIPLKIFDLNDIWQNEKK